MLVFINRESETSLQVWLGIYVQMEDKDNREEVVEVEENVSKLKRCNIVTDAYCKAKGVAIKDINIMRDLEDMLQWISEKFGQKVHTVYIHEYIIRMAFNWLLFNVEFFG